jgi:pilus assembly protein CpaD
MRAPFKHIAALALVAGLAACASPEQRDFTGSIPEDYRDRHPVVVTAGAEVIDLLPGGGPGGLTDRQVGDVQAFGGKWREKARGPITVEVPTGGASDRASAHAAREIRRIFLAMGVPEKAVVIRKYPADGPGHLAPVRLEFPVLEAKVPHACDQWPEDLGYGDPTSSNRNRSYWNFGCATQQNLAATVEDPEDFIRPRAEDAPNATRRSDVIRKYQKGEATPTANSVDVSSTR